jgi:hypothetical protein
MFHLESESFSGKLWITKGMTYIEINMFVNYIEQGARVFSKIRKRSVDGEVLQVNSYFVVPRS